LQIELNDHKGVSITGETIHHNQWIVMCDGIHVGYLTKTPGAWMSCIVFMDEATKQELIEAVSAAASQLVGGASLPVNPDFLDEGETDDFAESDSGEAD
jgi:hypothetical protein